MTEDKLKHAIEVHDRATRLERAYSRVMSEEACLTLGGDIDVSLLTQQERRAAFGLVMQYIAGLQDKANTEFASL